MKTGIHITACNTGSAEKHNRRDKDYLEKLDASGKKTYDIFRDETHLNSSWVHPQYKGRTLPEILEDSRQEVKAKTGRSMQAKATPIREGVCPIRPDTRLGDFQPVVDWFASHGAAVIRIDLHRDEGHTDAVTGQRKHNYHAHLVLDFIDHRTGKSVKLSKQDTSELQTVLANALRMERGTAVDETGARHLAAQEYREKKAGENAARLEAKAARLQVETDRAQRSMEEAQQREAEAVERAEEAEKAASREQLRSNLADAGARVAGLFGRGALAEAKADREARDAAEKEAAEARAAAERAQKAQKQAEFARSAAETAERTARQEKSAYGREMYENGVADGIKQGRQSAQASIAPLQEQLAAKQEQLDQAIQRAEAAENEVKNMKDWNPSMQNWQQSVKDMRAAGMSPQQIQQVFRRGYLEGVQVPVYEHRGTTYTEEAKVSLNPSKTTGNMQAWFNGTRLASFIEQAVQKVKRALGLNRGMHM